MVKSTENGPKNTEIGPKIGLRKLIYPITLSLLLVLQSCTKPPERIYKLHQKIITSEASEKQQEKNISKLTIQIDRLKDTIEAREWRGLDVSSEECEARKLVNLKEKKQKKLEKTKRKRVKRLRRKNRLEEKYPI